MPESLQAAIDALNKAQTQSYEVEEVLRWALAVVAKRRPGDPVPAEFGEKFIKGIRSMETLKNGIASAISHFKVHRIGI